MGKKTRAQQLRGNEQRRAHRSKARQDVFISEYISLKYFDLYAEAVKFYNALNTMYPVKYDLRKTVEYKTWKAEIKGQPLKIRKLPMPEHTNIQTVPPQSPCLSESPSQSQSLAESPPQNPCLAESPPQNPCLAESPPQSPCLSESPPQSPSLAESPPQSPCLSESPPQSPSLAESPPQSPCLSESPPQSPSLAESPPQSPTEKEPHVYRDNLQLRIPLIQYEPQTPRPTVTSETLYTVTEEILEENTIQPTIFEELAPGMLDQIINELRQEPDLRDIFTDIEQQFEFEQLGMDIDISEDNTLENELDQW